MAMRVLIVYEETGSGHFRTARLLKNMLASRYAVTITLCPGNRLLNMRSATALVRLWDVLIGLNMIRSADFVFNHLARRFGFCIYEAVGVGRFHRAVHLLHPEIIISTAQTYNKALGEYGRRHGVPVVVFITDITAFRDHVHPHALHLCYFEYTANFVRRIRTDRAYFTPIVPSSPLSTRVKFVARSWLEALLPDSICPDFDRVPRSIPSGEGIRASVVGPWADEGHYAAASDRIDGLNSALAAADPTVVLVVSGGIGGNVVYQVVRTLYGRSEVAIQILAMCGKDVNLLDRVMSSFGRASDKGVSVLPIGYTCAFESYLSRAGCIVMRPSASVFAEAVIQRVPIVAFGPCPSNDRGIVDIIVGNGLGAYCSSLQELPETVLRVLRNQRTHRERMEEFMRPYSGTFDGVADRICQEIEKNAPSLRGQAKSSARKEREHEGWSSCRWSGGEDHVG